MQIKSRRDFCAGLMFVIAGIAFAVASSNYSMGSAAAPGVGYFPLILSSLMTVLGIVVLFKSLTIETEGGEPIGAIGWRPLVLVIGAVAFFGAGLQPLGLIIAAPALIVIASAAGPQFSWAAVAVNSVVLTFLAWFILNEWFKLAVPLLPRFLAG